MSMAQALVQVRDLAKHYAAAGKRVVHAVDGVSLAVARGETLGLVGESGCGKSTLARLICCLERPTNGEVLFKGIETQAISSRELRALRPRMQLIFQDPFSSLNPHKTVVQIIALPLHIGRYGSKAAIQARVCELLDMVGLDPSQATRFPHQFSGGQRQRIAVARALACAPELIVADEPVASLDVSIQAQILQVMRRLQQRFRLTSIFISHDVSVVSHVSQRIAVMYLGKIVEIGPTESVIARPLHPYPRALLAAVPRLDRRSREDSVLLSGDPPNPMTIPRGCRFHTRCYLDQTPECRRAEPALREIRPAHFAACHLAG